jgi:hypothetical protein
MIGCVGEPMIGRSGLRVEGTWVVAVDADRVLWWCCFLVFSLTRSVVMGISGGGDGGMRGRAIGRGECRWHVSGHGWGYCSSGPFRHVQRRPPGV